MVTKQFPLVCLDPRNNNFRGIYKKIWETPFRTSSICNCNCQKAEHQFAVELAIGNFTFYTHTIF